MPGLMQTRATACKAPRRPPQAELIAGWRECVRRLLGAGWQASMRTRRAEVCVVRHLLRSHFVRSFGLCYGSAAEAERAACYRGKAVTNWTINQSLQAAAQLRATGYRLPCGRELVADSAAVFEAVFPHVSEL